MKFVTLLAINWFLYYLRERERERERECKETKTRQHIILTLKIFKLHIKKTLTLKSDFES